MFVDNYDLFAATDEHLTRPRFKPDGFKYFYPSEASVKIIDEFGDPVVHGGCLRSTFFRMSDNFQGDPNNARSEYIFLMGKTIENFLVDQWKQMGIWIDNSLKFVDHKNKISGELDAVLIEPPTGKLYGLECKSAYGYMAEKEIFGDRRTKGFPKMDHLLQTLVYLNYFKDKLSFFKIAYFFRDSVKRRTFKIELHEEENKLYPVVEGDIIRTFTVQDILARYKELDDYMANNTIPPRDYELQYTPNKIEDFYKKGKISKTKYEKFKNNKLGPYEYTGDWRCAYCNHKSICNPDC